MPGMRPTLCCAVGRRQAAIGRSGSIRWCGPRTRRSGSVTAQCQGNCTGGAHARGLTFLTGVVAGIVLATACRVTAVNAARETSVSPVVADTPSELPKPSRERTADVIQQSRDSVCLIEGKLAFLDRMTGEKLRRKQWLVTASDEILEIPFSGTGFLVSNDGMIVTNRHVAQPWSSDPEAQAILASGYRPLLTRLVASFPGFSKPLRLRVARSRNRMMQRSSSSRVRARRFGGRLGSRQTTTPQPVNASR